MNIQQFKDHAYVVQISRPDLSGFYIPTCNVRLPDLHLSRKEASEALKAKSKLIGIPKQHLRILKVKAELTLRWNEPSPEMKEQTQ